MDELEIAGKRYLSTRRAAKDHKYTSDYVGQLIRGGKVVGKKVGRSWYVEEQSLNAYLNGEAATPAPVLAEVPVVKTAPAPVERLVVEPVAEVAKEVEPVAIKEEEEKTFEPVVIKTKTLEEHHIPIRTSTYVEKEKPAVGLRYVVDDEPALPEIKRKSAVTVSPTVARVVTEPAEEIEEEVEIIPSSKVGSFAIAGLVVVGLSTLALTAALSATLNSRIVVEQGQAASVGYTFQ